MTRIDSLPEAGRGCWGRGCWGPEAMECGVIIGDIVQVDAEHLVLAGGSEIVAPDGLGRRDLIVGTTVMVTYALAEGRRVAETITLMPR